MFLPKDNIRRSLLIIIDLVLERILVGVYISKNTLSFFYRLRELLNFILRLAKRRKDEGLSF